MTISPPETIVFFIYLFKIVADWKQGAFKSQVTENLCCWIFECYVRVPKLMIFFSLGSHPRTFPPCTQVPLILLIYIYIFFCLSEKVCMKNLRSFYILQMLKNVENTNVFFSFFFTIIYKPWNEFFNFNFHYYQSSVLLLYILIKIMDNKYHATKYVINN